MGGEEEGLPGRLNLKKALIVVAAQEDGPGIGRIRMRQILDASGESLVPCVRASVAPGSVVHTDGWAGYLPLERNPVWGKYSCGVPVVFEQPAEPFPTDTGLRQPRRLTSWLGNSRTFPFPW